MADEIKFTQEELNAIAEIQKKYNEITFQFGQLTIEREVIQARLNQSAVDFENAKKELDNIHTQERNLAASFQAKYGEGQLNSQTGVFTPVVKG